MVIIIIFTWNYFAYEMNKNVSKHISFLYRFDWYQISVCFTFVL